MEGPPPARAPLGRPTVLTDLPADVLPYILSFIPFEEWESWHGRVVVSCFAAAAACTALAAEARPPSAAWTDVAIPERFFVNYSYTRRASPAAQHALRDAMARAAPSVRRLSLASGDYLPNTNANVPALMAAMAAPAAPFLKELDVGVRNNTHLSMFEPILAAATRLTRLKITNYCFVGPPPMIAAGCAAILAFRHNDAFNSIRPLASCFNDALELFRDVSAALPGVAVEPPVAARLEPNWLRSNFDHLGRSRLDALAEFERAFTRFGHNLTRLVIGNWTSLDLNPSIDFRACTDVGTALVGLLHGGALPALCELVIDWECSHFHNPLDLAGVHAPPPGLTFLSVRVYANAGILLSPAIRAGLASLAVERLLGDFTPPQCLRGAGASFGRLTRLVYGTLGPTTVNLACWCWPDFSLPTLVELEAAGANFAVEAWDRRTFCTSFLAELPSLTLWAAGRDRNLPPFAASIHMGKNPAAVRAIVTAGLPRAALDAGRHLAVLVHHVGVPGRLDALRSRFGWHCHSTPEAFGSLTFRTGAGRPVAWVSA
jgi:hypothetical protein